MKGSYLRRWSAAGCAPGPTGDAGWDSRRIASAFAELMGCLGYDRYGAQGGDFGAFVAPDLGRVAPEHVIGVHVDRVFDPDDRDVRRRSSPFDVYRESYQALRGVHSSLAELRG